MAMIFIFGFARKYLQEKKLGHFENPWTIFFETMFFFQITIFLHKTLTKKDFIFSTRVDPRTRASVWGSNAPNSMYLAPLQNQRTCLLWQISNDIFPSVDPPGKFERN